MKTVNIYYDRINDCLTFTKHKHIVAKAIANVEVPEGTVRDGDCVILPDAPTVVFKKRRVTPLELYIRAINNWGDGLSVRSGEIHGFFTFSAEGKHKPGICFHGEKFPCDHCYLIRQNDDKHRSQPMTDEEFENKLIRKPVRV